MKSLNQLANEYANKNFPTELTEYNVALRSFRDGFNEAMRILMQIAGSRELDNKISPFNFIEVE